MVQEIFQKYVTFNLERVKKNGSNQSDTCF